MRPFPVRSALPILGLSALLLTASLLCAAGAGPVPALVVTETRIPSRTLPPPTATASPSRTPSPTNSPAPTRTRLSLTAGPTPTPSLTPGAGNYVVQPGDYLYKIARQLDSTVLGIKTVNQLSSDEIFVGQVLAIPTLTPAKTKPATPTLMAGGQYYQVQPGDQLLPIARRFGVTVPALKTANGLSSDSILVGQMLVIPPPSPTRTPYPPERIYTVQPGDQLGVIAQRYGVTVTQIKNANGLSTSTIYSGQVLYIPLPGTAVAPAATRTATPVPTAVPAGAVVYTVKKGDRLSIIALWYGVTTASLKTTNKLSSDSVYVGQSIVILSPPLRPVGYVVQWGDNLTNLAQRYGTTVDIIKRANRMGADQSTIYRGLILIIPTASW